LRVSGRTQRRGKAERGRGVRSARPRARRPGGTRRPPAGGGARCSKDAKGICRKYVEVGQIVVAVGYHPPGKNPLQIESAIREHSRSANIVLEIKPATRTWRRRTKRMGEGPGRFRAESGALPALWLRRWRAGGTEWGGRDKTGNPPPSSGHPRGRGPGTFLTPNGLS